MPEGGIGSIPLDNKVDSIVGALEKAKEQKAPVVLAYKFPENKIFDDFRKYVSNKQVIFVALPAVGEDGASVPENVQAADEAARRYDLKEAEACLLDSFGNLIKGDLFTSNDMAKTAEEATALIKAFKAGLEDAVAKGKDYLAKGDFARASKKLKVFAYADGYDSVAAGRELFQQVQAAATDAYAALHEQCPALAEAESDVTKLSSESREELMDALDVFIESWDGTTEAITAEALYFRLEASLTPRG